MAGQADTSIIRLAANPEGFGDKPDKLDAEMFVSELPTQHSHSYYEDDDIGLYVGVWDTDDMVEAGGPYSCDEFMVLLEGEVSIRNNESGQFAKVKAGEAFVIPKGYDCQWQQKGYLRKYYFISEHPEEPMPEVPAYPGIVVLPGHEAGLTTAASQPQNHVAYVDITKRFSAGTWTSGVLRTEATAHPYHQLGYVQKGSIKLSECTAQGESEHLFVNGEAFFVPAGTEHSVQVFETATIVYSQLLASSA